MISRLKREWALASICGSLALLVVASCRSQTDSAPANNGASDTIVATTPPYKTKEPDRYSVTRTITTTTPGGATAVTRTFIARDGELRRNESEVASKKIVYLEVPAGRFVLLTDEDLYADLGAESGAGVITDEGPSPESLLHADLGSTSYQKMGTESIGGRNTNKYRIVVNTSNGDNVTVSETLIWIDEALGMPIRSETQSSDGTRVTMKLSEIALDVDRGLFQVPNHFQKVTLAELRKRLIGGN